jgi:ubiquinone/menaquinone biosynthesis C-methylase UbiE
MTELANAAAQTSRGGDYLLGHSEKETERLIAQATVYQPLTRRLLVEAGIAPGMRVLDLGSGAGDVAFLAAELVGQTGEVVGIDQNPAILAVARSRAAQGRANVSFIEGDLATVEPPGTFDALIGRLILMYQPDPAGTIRRFLPLIRPGGRVAFHEVDFEHAVMFPEIPLFVRGMTWWRTTLQRVGVEDRMGAKLYQAMLGAGLPEPSIIGETIISRAETGPVPMILSEVLRTVMPIMLRLGIVTEAELEIETLEERMRAEAAALNACVGLPEFISAWSRVP